MEISNTIRAGVVEALVEAKQIKDPNLRSKVYDAWALALQENGFERIEEMPHSAVPGVMVAGQGSQVDHLRGVARLALVIAEELKAMVDGFDVDIDEVIAGGLCHDLGKPFEYNETNRHRWSSDPSATGFPSVRHTIYGVHIALAVGLPEKIAHIAGAHSMEGQFVERSLACEIVHYADEAYWHVLAKTDIIDRKTSQGQDRKQ